jgi:tRNA(Met) C34 N-acetyltransferase TmcA
MIEGDALTDKPGDAFTTTVIVPFEEHPLAFVPVTE